MGVRGGGGEAGIHNSRWGHHAINPHHLLGHCLIDNTANLHSHIMCGGGVIVGPLSHRLILNIHTCRKGVGGVLNK